MLEIIRDWILGQGLDLPMADILARGTALVLILLLSLIAYLIAKRFILRGLAAIISRTATQWDDELLKKKVFNRLAHLAPAIVIYTSITIPFEGYDAVIAALSGLVVIFMIIMIVLALDAFLNASLAIYILGMRFPIEFR